MLHQLLVISSENSDLRSITSTALGSYRVNQPTWTVQELDDGVEPRRCRFRCADSREIKPGCGDFFDFLFSENERLENLTKQYRSLLSEGTACSRHIFFDISYWWVRPSCVRLIIRMSGFELHFEAMEREHLWKWPLPWRWHSQMHSLPIPDRCRCCCRRPGFEGFMFHMSELKLETYRCWSKGFGKKLGKTMNRTTTEIRKWPPKKSKQKSMPLGRMISQALVAMVGCSLPGFLLLSFGMLTSCFHVKFDFNFTSFAWICRSSTSTWHMNIIFELPLHHDCPTLLPSVKKKTAVANFGASCWSKSITSFSIFCHTVWRPKKKPSHAMRLTADFFLQTFVWSFTVWACLYA